MASGKHFNETEFLSLSAKLERVARDVRAVAEEWACARLGTSQPSKSILAEAARVALDRRKKRSKAYGDYADLFGDPVLDILLNTCVANADGLSFSVSKACHVAGVPATTALRIVGKLEKRGLVARCADPFDRRRNELVLTEAGVSMLRDALGGSERGNMSETSSPHFT